MPDTNPIPQVQFTDPKAHEKLDRILDWINGDQMRGIPGMAAEHRKHADKIEAHDARLDRHSKRIRDLEERPANAGIWALRTIAEKIITIAAAGLAGWLAGKPH